MKRYLTSHLWESFQKECPIISKIPVFNYWAFGHFVVAYFRSKQPFCTED